MATLLALPSQSRRRRPQLTNGAPVVVVAHALNLHPTSGGGLEIKRLCDHMVCTTPSSLRASGLELSLRPAKFGQKLRQSASCAPTCGCDLWAHHPEVGSARRRHWNRHSASLLPL